MKYTYIKSIFSLTLCLIFISITQAQNDCVPTTGVAIAAKGEVSFNYGSTTNAVTVKRASSIILGEPVVGQSNNTKYTTEFGFYAQFLLPPQNPAVIASQGEYLDRIEVKWDSNPLGGSSTGGFNIYRDGIFIATVGPKIRNFNDFNVIAGRPYTYTITGLNDFGEGSTGSAIGFMVPNGVVTGLVETPNGSPVVDAIVSLEPMQGFSVNFDGTDGAGSIYNSANPYLPSGNSDWTISYWIKTTSSIDNGAIIQFGPNNTQSLRFLSVESANITQYGESIYPNIGVGFSYNNQTLQGVFPFNNRNDWHHITLSHQANDHLTSLYIDGKLASQKPINIPSITGAINIGNRFMNGGWNGKMDELRIYHRALNEAEIEETMLHTGSSNTPDLAYYWKMDEELGNKCFDIINRHVIYLCGATFDQDRPSVHTSGKTNPEGYYRIEGVSYGTGQTFIAKPSKDFFGKRSLEFSAQDHSFVTLPAWPLETNSTIELWFNGENNPVNQTLLSKKFGSDEFRISIVQNGNLRTLQFSTNQGSFQSSGIASGYNHLAMTVNGNNINVYLNGSGAGSGSLNLSNINDLSQNWILGAANAGTQDWYNGYIDEIAVYNNIQSLSQIQQHFQSNRPSPESHLTVYYQLDEGSGNKVNNIGSLQLPAGNVTGAKWNSLAPHQERSPHEFTPKTRQVTLNPSVTSVDRIDFIDRSTIPVSGYVRYNNTECFQKSVEILVNGASFNPPVYTDSIGKFVIDVDPGFNGILTPAYKDHIFSPPVYEVENVINPIAGIVFYNMESRRISGKVIGGNEQCNKSIIQNPGTPQGTICIVKVATADNCLQRTFEIMTEEGEYEFNNLPPIETMIVTVIEHSDPSIKTSFQVQGGKTANLEERDTIFDFRYFAEPQIEVISGLESFSNDCSLIVWEKGNTQQLIIKLKEQYPTIPVEDGVCYLDTANFKIVNGINDLTLDTTMNKMSNKQLNYSFVVGEPNPSPPYLKTISILAQSESGNESEFTAQALVLGYKAKANTFTTISPETPSIVLRDPPGDASYAYIEKNTSVCTNISLSNEKTTGAGGTGILDLGPDQDIVAGPVILTFESDLGGEFVGVQTVTKTSSSSAEICTSFNEVISTSDDENFIGGDGDIFVGGALNIDYGNVDIIAFDTMNCAGTASQTVLVLPGNYATQFMYSRNNIVNNVIPSLEKLMNLSVDTAEISKYNQSISRWNLILNNNEEAKAKTSSVRNISFDAGITYENSITSDTSDTKSAEEIKAYVNNQDIHVLFSINGIGGGTIIHVINEGSDSKSNETGNAKGITVGYALHDDDPLDAFSVEIGMDSFYNTPIFRTKVGQSSCPWEPNTAKREGVNLTAGADGPVRVDVPANEPAVYHFTLGNTSETNEEVTALLTMANETNPHGAKVFCNGVSLSQGLEYTIPYGESVPVTITVEKGPIEYDYDSLVIALSSICQNDDPAFYDPVALYAHFIKPCSEVDINVPEQNWVLFPNPLTSGDDNIRQITVSGFDTSATDFKLIRVQYRPVAGDGAWINIQTQNGIAHEVYNGNWIDYNSLPAPSPAKITNNFYHFFWNTLGLADGEYEIRALTECSGDAVNRPGYSQVIKGRIDRQPPQLLGVPQPSDGVYHVGDEISFTFNQSVNCNKLIQADMNNPNNVGLYHNNTLIDVQISCHDNKIILDPNFDNEFFENKILRAELHNIEDLVGNKLIEEEWEFYVDRNELAWLTDSIEVVKFVDETKTISAKIHNRGGYPVPFTIINVPDWLHVYPDRGTLVANEIQEIHFTVNNEMDLGEIEDNVILRTETGINPFFMGGDEPLNIKTRNLCRPESWVLNPSGFNTADYSYSMNFIVQLDIEGTISVDENDIVGAYVDGQLRGIAKLQYKASLNKYLAFLTVYSNVNTGEEIKFQIWDASDCKLYAYALENFTFLADDVEGTLSNCVILHTNTTLLRKIFLHEGWNWISLNLDLVPNDINPALSSLSSPQGSLIKEQTTFSAYSQNASSWIGTLDTLSPKRLYQYHAQEEDSLSIIGNYIDPTLENIPLTTGWNWIGYLPTQSLKVDEALATVNATNGDILKSQLYFAQYLTGVGWIGNLTSMNAPNGYLLKLANASTLTYPDPLDFRSDIESGSRDVIVPNYTGLTEVNVTSREELPFEKWQVDPTKYEYSMNAIAIVVESEAGNNLLHDGDEVAAFVNNEVRGSGKAIFIPALNSYMIFMTIYANLDGERMELKYFDSSANKEYGLHESVNFKINSIIGQVDAPEHLHLSGTTSVNDVGYDAKLAMYPNPFANTLHLQYQLNRAQEVTVTINDVYGKLVETKNYSAKAGSNNFEWKPITGLSGGTYLITVESEEGTYSNKVLYIK